MNEGAELGGAYAFMSDELGLLRESVREFMKRDVRPVEDEVDFDAYKLPDHLLAPLQAKAKQAGLWCIASPASAGGAGLPLLAQTVVTEEASKCRMGAYHLACGAFGWDPPGIIFGGTESQIDRYAKPTIASGKKTFVAMTEPAGGSDPARSIATSATRTDGGWLLNGTKVFISGIDETEWGIVFARTDKDAGRKGLSVFVVETASDGLSYRPIQVIRSWAPFEVHFDDVFVPDENLLGEEGEGFRLAQEWLVHGRVPYAAGCIGIAAYALSMATDYARNRTLFGSPLSEKQAIQWMLADSDLELRAARSLTYEAAAKADAGHSFKVEASAAKVFATEAAGRVVDRCIQVFGGLGVSSELPLERWYRELRIKRIGEGPSEVHRMVLARHLLRS